MLANVVAAALGIYFLASAFDALLNVDAKLERIGLSAVSEDGKIAFILIYSGLMSGIAAAMATLSWHFKSPRPALLVAANILLAFIVFRFVGSAMIGSLSTTQIGYIATELVELSILSFVLYKTKRTNMSAGTNC